MGKFYFNNIEPSQIFLGSKAVKEIYLGTEKVWPTESSYPDYLCFTSDGNFTITMVKNSSPTYTPSLEYSKDRNIWTTFTPGSTTISAVANEKIYMRGDNDYINSSVSSYWYFRLSGTNIAASGNIMSLLDKTCLLETINNNQCFCNLFKNCTSLTIAPELPAITLAINCYYGMFFGCTSLVIAPKLSVTILANRCYMGMFQNCTSLTAAPKLPATTLVTYCYNGMFRGCASLTTTPALPATTLATYCYGVMFYDCTSLTTVPALPATTLASNCYNYMFGNCSALKVYSSSGTGYTNTWRIPTSGTASSYTSQSYMFYGTTGTYKSSTSVSLNRTFYTQNPPIS